MLTPDDCCVLNGGGGAWAFEALAADLASALWVDISATPRRYNYLLLAEGRDAQTCGRLFVPYPSVVLASDKRLLAEAFARHKVPTPTTHLAHSWGEVSAILRGPGEWCLKYPLGCGGAGHRLLTRDSTPPKNWPTPYVVQEFIRLGRPEVYRTYAAGGQVFGWVARRSPEGAEASPWVAHARGARYVNLGEPPPGAVAAAQAALAAAGLLDSFGCVDLLRRPAGEWVVLEVGTDGIFNHVDRDVGDVGLEGTIRRRVAEAFWANAGPAPWAPGEWRPRP